MPEAKCDATLVASARATAATLIVITIVATARAVATTAMASAVTTAVIVSTMATATATAMASAATTMALTQKLIDSSLADLDYGTREKESLTGKRMVEVKLDHVILNTEHSANDVLPLVVNHGYARAKLKQILAQASVWGDEYILRNVSYSLGEAGAIRLIGRQCDLKRVTRLEILNAFLECRQHSPGAENETERVGRVTLLNDRSFVAI